MKKSLLLLIPCLLAGCSWFQKNPDKTKEIEKDLVDAVETIVTPQPKPVQ